MKKIYLLLASIWLSSFGYSQYQTCDKEYISNGDIENYSGSGSNYDHNTLPAWSRYIGHPKVSGANAPTSPQGQSILLREDLSNNSSNGTYNTLYNTVTNGSYVLELYVKATQNKTDGEIAIILTNNLTQTAVNAYPDPDAAINTILADGQSKLVKYLTPAHWGNQQNWVKIQLPIDLTSGFHSYSQLLFLPKKNNPSTSPQLEVRIDGIKLRNQNTLIGYAYAISHEKCGCDGRIEVFAGGGTGPYAYTISEVGSPFGQMGPITYTATNAPGSNVTHKTTISNLCPGTYNIEIVDQNQCKRTSQVTINPSSCPQNPYPILNASYTGGGFFAGNYYGDQDIHFYSGTYFLSSGTKWEMKSCNIQYDQQGQPDPNSYPKIYLHQGARIIMDNTTITSFCDNAWYGIIMKDPTAELIILGGSKMEHAYKAISGEGGQININRAEFVNNLNAISDLKVDVNNISSSNFSSSSFQLPFPYNGGFDIMEKAIHLQSNTQSIIFDNEIDDVEHGIEVWIKGTNNFTQNRIKNVRKIGMSLYNLTGSQIIAEENEIELNATYFHPISHNEVIGIYQLNYSLPNLNQLNVKFYNNKITRTTGTVGKDLVGISEVSFGDDDQTSFEKNHIELDRTFSGTSYAFRSRRDHINASLYFRLNTITNTNVGMQLGNGSNYSDIDYQINCNYFKSLDWGISTYPYQAPNNSLDYTKLIIGKSSAPAANTWKFIPTDQLLRNNSSYKLYYYRALDESISNQNCFNYSATKYNVIGTSIDLNTACP